MQFLFLNLKQTSFKTRSHIVTAVMQTIVWMTKKGPLHDERFTRGSQSLYVLVLEKIVTADLRIKENEPLLLVPVSVFVATRFGFAAAV